MIRIVLEPVHLMGDFFPMDAAPDFQSIKISDFREWLRANRH